MGNIVYLAKCNRAFVSATLADNFLLACHEANIITIYQFNPHPFLPLLYNSNNKKRLFRSSTHYAKH